MTALKSLPVSSTEVSSGIECYHHQLKLRLLNEKDCSVYQRADWLVDKLGTKVHSYYWLDEYSGKDNFSRYWKDEWRSGLTSWRTALQIPDSDVIMECSHAKVVDQKDRANVHIVLNPGSEFPLCDCNWSRLGNICEHAIKSTNSYRFRGLVASSTSLFNYRQSLVSILRCPPCDSVIRDHAMALAVSVRSQLNALFDLEDKGKISEGSLQQSSRIPETEVLSGDAQQNDHIVQGIETDATTNEMANDAVREEIDHDSGFATVATDKSEEPSSIFMVDEQNEDDRYSKMDVDISADGRDSKLESSFPCEKERRKPKNSAASVC